jgi:hypothetical protein
VLLAYRVSPLSDIFAEQVDASVLRFRVNPKPNVAARVSKPSLSSSLWIDFYHFPGGLPRLKLIPCFLLYLSFASRWQARHLFLPHPKTPCLQSFLLAKPVVLQLSMRRSVTIHSPLRHDLFLWHELQTGSTFHQFL